MSSGGQTDYGALARRVRQLQAQMSGVQPGLKDLQATGSGGGGLVTATVSGEGRLVGLDIDRSVMKPRDTRSLAELIIAAVNGASEAAAGLRSERLAPFTDGLQDLQARLRPDPPAGLGVAPRLRPDPPAGLGVAPRLRPDPPAGPGVTPKSAPRRRGTSPAKRAPRRGGQAGDATRA
jgi:nucleoid-associated protein EbfC